MSLSKEELEYIAKTDPELGNHLRREWRKAMIVLARNDPSYFCEYVLRDEKTGGPIYQTPDHIEMHQALRDYSRTVIWTYPGMGKTNQISIGYTLWQLGKNPNQCEGTGAPILRADGVWVPIERLQHGRHPLLTWDGKGGTLKLVHGTSVPNGKQAVRVIRLSNGTEMRLTEEHPLMMEDGSWKAAWALAPGDSVRVLRRLDLDESYHTAEEELPADEAMALGFLLYGRIKDTRVVLPKLNDAMWLARRSELFDRIGWRLKPVSRLVEEIEQGSAEMSPADFVRCHAVLDGDGWPIDFLPSVWQAPIKQVRRILTGFTLLAMAEVKQPDSIIAKRLGCTAVGVGASNGVACRRVPTWIGHPSCKTMDLWRRLALRVGACFHLSLRRNARIAHTTVPFAQWSLLQPVKTKLSISYLERLRFWPSARLPEDDPPLMGTTEVVSAHWALDPEETWALSIEEEEHSYLSGGVVSHNTIAIMSNTAGQAEKIVSALKEYIQISPELKDVFPNLRPGDKWSGMAFNVDRSTIRKDFSVQATGLNGSIVGARLDGLVIDDIDDVDSTHTKAAREQTLNWVRKQGMTRVDGQSWVVGIGNVWNEEDCLHSLSRSESWKKLRYPLLVPTMQEDGSVEMVTRDPARFPMERVYQIRDDDVGAVAFQQLYLLQARVDGEQRFQREWVELALDRGKGVGLCKEALERIPAGVRIATGVDLGIKKKRSSDPTVLVTVLEAPAPREGKPNAVDRQILDIRKGRWNIEETIAEITRTHRDFGGEVWVETNGAQDFLLQAMQMIGSQVPVKAFTTGRNKHDPTFGVESIASEMANGVWIWPSWDGQISTAEPEIRQLCDEVLAYTPGAHTGDILMALWICREALRQQGGAMKGKVQFGRLGLRRR